MTPSTRTPDVPTSLASATPLQLRDDERQRCEVWTRVMGYHRPVASFNIGKQGEFNERRHFVEGQTA
jgi:Anaerobic ribonucleoside-triphosphate reductase